MKWIRRYRHVMSIVVLTVFLGAAMGKADVSAAEYNSGRTGSITVELNDLGTDKSNVAFRVYRVSNIDADIDFTEIDKSSSEEMKELAEKLEKYVKESKTQYVEQLTNEKGIAVFKNLAQDIYLIVQETSAGYGMVSPFFVEIPYMEDGKEWVYDVTAQPKGEMNTPEPEKPEQPDQPDQVQTGDSASGREYYILTFIFSLVIFGVCLRERMKHEGWDA